MEMHVIAALAGLGISICLYPLLIENLNSMNIKQTVSEYALDEFKDKKKTPTFGGLIFVLLPIFLVIVLSFFNFSNNLLLLVIIYAGHGLLGFIDDYKIVKDGKNDGISPKVKMLGQVSIAFVFYGLYLFFGGDNTLTIHSLNMTLNLGWFYGFLVVFMMVGTSNAVNLTDGMDGLAGGTFLLSLIPFAYFAYVDARMDILLMIVAVFFSVLGFLKFNKKPARIFMGDVGSLPLGAFLAALSILLGRELLLVLTGIVFVYETITVIIQRISWKIRKKRVFKYTPIHYSFTLSGWSEQGVVSLFYLIGFIGMLLSLLLGIFL